MSNDKSKADFFGSYLTRLNDAPEANQPSKASSGSPEIAILKTLMISTGPVAIKALLPILGLPPSLLIKTLDSLKEARLVEDSSTATDESVSITDLGRKIAG
ncbi:MAG TPA: hypothetical protein VJS15_00480 [Allosphingosinicella sp.]|nr:hypothetical protein [Allosphingosinicella sp.]